MALVYIDAHDHIVSKNAQQAAGKSPKRDYRIKDPPIRFSFKNRPMLIQKNATISPLVEIICFCLMPNHFHMLIRQIENNGITIFLSKLGNSYTKYFNTKYTRVGPLFQGSFKAVRMEDDGQLLHVSSYIHLNPLIDYLTKDLKTYPYSSYPEFLGLRKGFCKKEVILDNFKTPSDYEKFVLDQEDYGRKIKHMERMLIDANS